MKVSSWFLMLLCITAIGFWLGIPSPMATMNAQGEPLVLTCADGGILCNNAIVGVLGLAILVGVGGVSILAYITGFGTVYLIPLFILVAITSWVALPIGWIYDAGIPTVIRIPLIAAINLLTVLAVVSFVRGGE